MQYMDSVHGSAINSRKSV